MRSPEKKQGPGLTLIRWSRTQPRRNRQPSRPPSRLSLPEPQSHSLYPMSRAQQLASLSPNSVTAAVLSRAGPRGGVGLTCSARLVDHILLLCGRLECLPSMLSGPARSLGLTVAARARLQAAMDAMPVDMSRSDLVRVVVDLASRDSAFSLSFLDLVADGVPLDPLPAGASLNDTVRYEFAVVVADLPVASFMLSGASRSLLPLAAFFLSAGAPGVPPDGTLADPPGYWPSVSLWTSGLLAFLGSPGDAATADPHAVPHRFSRALDVLARLEPVPLSRPEFLTLRLNVEECTGSPADALRRRALYFIMTACPHLFHYFTDCPPPQECIARVELIVTMVRPTGVTTAFWTQDAMVAVNNLLQHDSAATSGLPPSQALDALRASHRRREVASAPQGGGCVVASGVASFMRETLGKDDETIAQLALTSSLVVVRRSLAGLLNPKGGRLDMSPLAERLTGAARAAPRVAAADVRDVLPAARNLLEIPAAVLADWLVGNTPSSLAGLGRWLQLLCPSYAVHCPANDDALLHPNSHVGADFLLALRHVARILARYRIRDLESLIDILCEMRSTLLKEHPDALEAVSNIAAAACADASGDATRSMAGSDPDARFDASYWGQAAKSAADSARQIEESALRQLRWPNARVISDPNATPRPPSLPPSTTPASPATAHQPTPPLPLPRTPAMTMAVAPTPSTAAATAARKRPTEPPEARTAKQPRTPPNPADRGTDERLALSCPEGIRQSGPFRAGDQFGWASSRYPRSAVLAAMGGADTCLDFGLSNSQGRKAEDSPAFRQARCPCPDTPGHRFPGDFLHNTLNVPVWSLNLVNPRDSRTPRARPARQGDGQPPPPPPPRPTPVPAPPGC